MSDLIEKMCACPNKSVCPTMYAKPLDESALQINSRTQIKFCEPITSLLKCKPNQLAVTMKRIYHLDNLQSGKTILHCLCDQYSYWKFNQSYGDYLDNDKAMIEISDDYICSGRFGFSLDLTFFIMFVFFFRIKTMSTKRILWVCTI